MSTSFDAEKLKSIDERDRNIIYGFIREFEINFLIQHKNNPFYTIPNLIIYTVLLYFSEPECFSIPCKSAIISDDKMTITGGSFNATTYGSYIINSEINGIYIWKFKVLIDSTFINIGIDESKCEWIEDCFHIQTKTKQYAFWCGARKYQWDSKDSMGKEYGIKYDKKDNTMTMLLHFSKNKSFLSFKVNNIDYGIAFDKVARGKGIKYRMAIDLTQNESCKLIDFQRIYVEE